jgi:hypothetical protein
MWDNFHQAMSGAHRRSLKPAAEAEAATRQHLRLRLVLALLQMSEVFRVSVCSLRENPSLSCVKIFAVRFLSGARQRASLPCVLYRAHGKQKAHGKK